MMYKFGFLILALAASTFTYAGIDDVDLKECLEDDECDICLDMEFDVCSGACLETDEYPYYKCEGDDEMPDDEIPDGGEEARQRGPEVTSEDDDLEACVEDPMCDACLVSETICSEDEDCLPSEGYPYYTCTV
jgi:hypothetical protein